MAHTAHKTAEAMEEIEMPRAEMLACAEKTAELIRNAKRVVFFTGAGLSTSSGISDYRGTTGVWTLAAKGQTRTQPSTPMSSAVATPSHMAIVDLIQRGLAHYVISQNVDGLHRKSGVPADCISELHGNSNVEECNRCGREYWRDFTIHGARGDHFTGRMCSAPGCDGHTRDTIINFGENLSERAIRDGFGESEKADLHICLGSSLTVSPAVDMPRATHDKGGKIVIVNLQRTPLDAMSNVRVYAKLDSFMIAVMEYLGLPAPTNFTLRRRVTLRRSKDAEDKSGTGTCVSVSSVDDDSHKATMFQSAAAIVSGNGNAAPASNHNVDDDDDAADSAPMSPSGAAAEDVDGTMVTPELRDMLAAAASTSSGSTANVIKMHADVNSEEFECALPSSSSSSSPEVRVVVEFFGHYDEPDAVLTLPQGVDAVTYELSLSVGERNRRRIADEEPHLVLPWRAAKTATPMLPTNTKGPGAPSRRDGKKAPAPPKPHQQDTSGWFAVSPVATCPHCEELKLPENLTVDIEAPCETCGNVGENMLDVASGRVFCGRFVKKHALAHYEQTGHPIVFGFVDLSCWCYECNVYIDAAKNRHLKLIHALLHKAKFGEGSLPAGL